MRALPLALLLAACGDGGDAPVDTDVAPDTDTDVPGIAPVQAVFDRSCASIGCHAGDAPAAGLALTPGASYGNLVGIPAVGRPSMVRVAAGDLDGSWLWHKINGTMTDVDPTDGSDAMPPPFGLAGDDVAVIRAWIEAGAPE